MPRTGQFCRSVGARSDGVLNRTDQSNQTAPASDVCLALHLGTLVQDWEPSENQRLPRLPPP